MRERQVDHPGAIDRPSGHGLGWWLPARPGVVEHGGDMIGITALLRLVPEQGMAVAMLTNGGSAGPIVDELLDPLLVDLASGIAPAAATPEPDLSAAVSAPERYVGDYETRQYRHQVRHESGRLWLTTTDCHEAVTMAQAAGAPLAPIRRALAPAGDDVFVRVDSSGASHGRVAFLGAGDRAGLLYDGRNASRVEL